MAATLMTTLVFILSLFEASIYAQSTTSTISSTANSTSISSTPITSPATKDNESASVYNIFIKQNIIYVILMVLFIIIIILCFILICYVRAKTRAIKRKFNALELRHYNNQYIQHATPTQTHTNIDISVPSPIPPKHDEQINSTFTTQNHPIILPPPIIISNINRIPAHRNNFQITPINSRPGNASTSVDCTPVHALHSTPMNIKSHVLSHTSTGLEVVRTVFQSNLQIEGHGIDINASTDDESNESMYTDHDPEIVDGPRKVTVTSVYHDQNSPWPVQQQLGNNDDMLSEISHDTEEKCFEPELPEAKEKLDVMITKSGLTIENKVVDTSNKYKELEQMYHKQYIEKIKDLEKGLDKVKQTTMIDSLSLEVQVDIRSATQKKNAQNNFIMSKMPNSIADVKKDILFPNGKRNKVCIRNYQEFFSK